MAYQQQQGQQYYNPNMGNPNMMQPGMMQPNMMQPGMQQGGSPVTIINVTNNQKGWEESDFRAQFCGCCDDIGSCMMSWCCPCIQYGLNHDDLLKDGCCSNCCIFAFCMPCGISFCILSSFRGAMRNKFNIPGTSFGDCCASCCCPCCTIAQGSREIVARRKEAAEKGILF